jgi:hypothetical protein
MTTTNLPPVSGMRIPCNPPSVTWEVPQNPTGGTTNDRRLHHGRMSSTNSAFSINRGSARINVPRGPSHHQYPHSGGTAATTLSRSFREASAHGLANIGPVTRQFKVLILPYGVHWEFI